MKKLFVFLFCISAGLFGYGQSDYAEHTVSPGFQAGDQLFSVFIGMATPRGKSGAYVGSSNEELAWGDNGVQYGFEWYYFTNPYVGYGFEIGGMNTAYAAKQVNAVRYRTAMDLWNGMLSLRFNLNPYDTVRFYVPVGGGMTYARSRCYMNTQKQSEVGRDVSFGYFAGLGAEMNWHGADKAVGLEMRYHGFGFDTDKLLDGRPASGNKNYGYFSVLLKLNYRF